MQKEPQFVSVAAQNYSSSGLPIWRECFAENRLFSEAVGYVRPWCYSVNIPVMLSRIGGVIDRCFTLPEHHGVCYSLPLHVVLSRVSCIMI